VDVAGVPSLGTAEALHFHLLPGDLSSCTLQGRGRRRARTPGSGMGKTEKKGACGVQTCPSRGSEESSSFQGRCQSRSWFPWGPLSLTRQGHWAWPRQCCWENLQLGSCQELILLGPTSQGDGEGLWVCTYR
jgi:hypothetical protein